MKKFFWAAVWVLSLGVLSNFLAPFVPRTFRMDAFPFRLYGFERGGRLYDRIAIRRWKNLVPDMSRYMKRLMRKTVTMQTPVEQTLLLAQETCVSELVHDLLILLSFAVLLFWRGRGAILFLLVYNVFGNLPYILIQRYNRPRLLELAEKQRRMR
jgi:glycosyl-4,4'-diaponeurosporenoate acyltransferase